MKQEHPGGFTGAKIYMTEADPSCQRLFGINETQFDTKMKLWLLLSDHTILSTSHMLRSETTFHWLQANSGDIAELAAERSLLVSLRDDRVDIRDYVTQDGKATDQPSDLLAKRKLYLERAAVLSELFPASISWSAKEESTWFKKCLVQQLHDANSPLRRRMVGIRASSISALADAVDSADFLNREIWTLLVSRYCPTRTNLLAKFGDILYYLSGAVHKNAFPALNAGATELCLEKIKYAVSTVSPDRHKGAELWKEVADAWGFTSSELHRLPLREVIALRRDAAGKRVRKTWGRLLESARDSRPTGSVLADFLSSKSRLISLFEGEVARQRRRASGVEKIRKTIDVISWSTGGLSTVSVLAGLTQPIFGLIGLGVGLLGATTGPPIADAIEKRISGTELVILASRINN